MGKGKVLIVDDDAVLSTRVAGMLEDDGYEVFVSDSAEGVVGEYDLYMLDMHLSGISGLEYLRRLRETNDSPAMIASSNTSEALAVMALESGADDFIAKPFRSVELLARVRAVMRRYAA